MNITLRRSANVLRDDRAYCIGHLYIDGEFFCDTLEDYDRGLCSYMDVEEIASRKFDGATAIPTGQYEVDMTVTSPKYMNKKFYKDFCKAMMPRLCFVKCYQGVLIHPGNTEADTEGCILVGQNKEVGKVINSRDTWCALYDILRKAHNKGESISINIIRSY